jgi:predicted phosphodiesterase
MTRLAVLADIHGNLPALEAVIADMSAFEVDHVVVAGDSINWGPFSVEVLQQILDRRWSLIRGNHEFYLLHYNTPHAPEAWRNFQTPRWLNEDIPKHLRSIIASLPDELRLCFPGTPYVRVVHGSPGNHWQGIYATMKDEQIAALLDGVEETVVIAAHTHLPLDRCVGKWHILNPGSVGVPLDGIHGARYLILEADSTGWNPVFRHVPYDLEALMRGWHRTDRRNSVTGRLFIEEARQARPMLYAFNQWRRTHYPHLLESPTMVDEFLALGLAHISTFFPEDYQINLEQL